MFSPFKSAAHLVGMGDGGIPKPKSSELLTFVIVKINCSYKLYIFYVKKKYNYIHLFYMVFSKFEKLKVRLVNLLIPIVYICI